MTSNDSDTFVENVPNDEDVGDDDAAAAAAAVNDDPIMSTLESETEDATATTLHAASLIAASLVDDDCAVAQKAEEGEDEIGGGVKNRDNDGNPVVAAQGAVVHGGNHYPYYPQHAPPSGQPPYQQQHASGWPQQQPYYYPPQYPQYPPHHYPQAAATTAGQPSQNPPSALNNQQQPPVASDVQSKQNHHQHGYPPAAAPLGPYPHHFPYAPQHAYYPPYPPASYPQRQRQAPARSGKSRSATAKKSSPTATAHPDDTLTNVDTEKTNSDDSSPAKKKQRSLMTTLQDQNNVPRLLCDADPRIPPSARLLQSHAALSVGAYVRLEGLLNHGDGAYNVREPYDRCFEGYGGTVVGYDQTLQRWNVKIEFRNARSVLPFHAILQCLPRNMYVEEAAPLRSPTDGSILLERNAGGFAVRGDRHLIWDCQERAEKMQWYGHETEVMTERHHGSGGGSYVAPGHDRRALNGKEEYIIREALLRINDCSRQLIPFRDEVHTNSRLSVSRDKAWDEVFDATARGRDLFKWPRDRICGGMAGSGRRNGGPYLCGFAAVFGPQHDRCLCEYCFCGYIGKQECTCNAIYWALCSTMGWSQEIKDYDDPSVRATVVYAARQVAMYPPFRLFDSHYPGLSEDDSKFEPDKPQQAEKDKKSEQKETVEQKEASAKENTDDTSTKSEMPKEQQRHQKEVVDKAIRWEAEVLPGVWRRYQPYLESRMEQLFNMGSPHYLYRPGNKAVEGTFLNLPDGHGRPPPSNVATRRILFHPHWREVEMHSGLCARVRRTGPVVPQTAVSNGNEAATATKENEEATTMKDDQVSPPEVAAEAETGDAAPVADTGNAAETSTELADDTKEGIDA